MFSPNSIRHGTSVVEGPICVRWHPATQVDKATVLMATLDLTALARAAKLNAPSDPVGQFDGRNLKVSRFSEHPRWELHPRGDELLQVIEGELEVILLQGSERTEVVLAPGEVFVVPTNVWHSPLPRGPVALLSIANYEGTRISNDGDPRNTSSAG
jgi:mannose-6-phosphate isomerase-like protein (cupin superfamily)